MAANSRYSGASSGREPAPDAGARPDKFDPTGKPGI